MVALVTSAAITLMAASCGATSVPTAARVTGISSICSCFSFSISILVTLPSLISSLILLSISSAATLMSSQYVPLMPVPHCGQNFASSSSSLPHFLQYCMVIVLDNYN